MSQAHIRPCVLKGGMDLTDPADRSFSMYPEVVWATGFVFLLGGHCQGGSALLSVQGTSSLSPALRPGVLPVAPK